MKPIAATFAIVALLVGAGTALGAFSTPTDLSATGGDASGSQIAIGPDGATTVVWYRSEGSDTLIQAATRPAGASTFGAPVNLSAPVGSAYDPQIAIGPDGATTVVWRRSTGGGFTIQARTRPPGSANFGDIVDLTLPGTDAYDPQVAAGPNGAVTVVWRKSGTNDVIEAATRPTGSSPYGAPVGLSASGGDAAQPQVVTGTDGVTTVVWKRNNGSDFIVQARTRTTASAAFGDPIDLSAVGGSANRPHVAVGPGGETTVVWSRFDGTSQVIQSTTRPAGSSTFGEPIPLSATGGGAYDPQLAVDENGATTVTWTRSDGANDIAQARTRLAGASAFADVVSLSASGDTAFDPQVAVGPGGATAVVWSRSEGSIRRVQGATRDAAAAAFGATADLSAGGQNAGLPRAAFGPNGSATVVWERSNGSFSIIQASTSAPTRARVAVSRVGAGSGSVTSAPAGISCAALCSAYFPIGASVTLIAAPASGSVFGGWSGACAGIRRSCTVRIDADTAVSASFLPAPTIRVEKTTRSVGRSKVTLKTWVTVSEAGTITQRTVRRGGKAEVLCRARRVARAQGTFVLTCVMGRAARTQLRRRAIRYTATTTFVTATSARVSAAVKGLVPRKR